MSLMMYRKPIPMHLNVGISCTWDSILLKRKFSYMFGYTTVHNIYHSTTSIITSLETSSSTSQRMVSIHPSWDASPTFELMLALELSSTMKKILNHLMSSISRLDMIPLSKKMTSQMSMIQSTMNGIRNHNISSMLDSILNQLK